MSLRTKFFAATYDRQMRNTEKAGLTQIRRGLVSQAAGSVLEIGGGTGANLAHYGPSVTSLTITEPDASMLKRLERQVSAKMPSTIVLRAPAEDLPFEDETFDVVVSTLVLCGVDDQPRAAREIRRVLRPGGEFLFLEVMGAGDAFYMPPGHTPEAEEGTEFVMFSPAEELTAVDEALKKAMQQ